MILIKDVAVSEGECVPPGTKYVFSDLYFANIQNEILTSYKFPDLLNRGIFKITGRRYGLQAAFSNSRGEYACPIRREYL